MSKRKLSEAERNQLLAVSITAAHISEQADSLNLMLCDLLDLFAGKQPSCLQVFDLDIDPNKPCCANCARHCAYESQAELDGTINTRVKCDLDNEWHAPDGWCPQYPVVNADLEGLT